MISNAKNVQPISIMTHSKSNVYTVQKISHTSMAKYVRHAPLISIIIELPISVKSVQVVEITLLQKNSVNAQKPCSGMMWIVYHVIFPNISISQRRSVSAAQKIRFMICKWRNVLIAHLISLSLMDRSVFPASCLHIGMQLQVIVLSVEMVKLMILKNFVVFVP